MEKISIVGLDLAKNVFQVHGATADGTAVVRKKLTRAQVLSFFAGLRECVVAIEACASSHYWAREIGRLGHDVRLIAPAYVKPFVRRNKNDAADAEAIAEAAMRPTMRFVTPKSEEQRQPESHSRHGTCSCASEPRRSMRCADISPNTG
jgi:transposase